ncbi:MAG: hypothetical protein QXJ17_04550 [Nitrososphaeria archaeon]
MTHEVTEVVLDSTNMRRMAHYDYPRRFGFRCYRCGRWFDEGDEVILRGYRHRKYYCIQCAKALYLVR